MASHNFSQVGANTDPMGNTPVNKAKHVIASRLREAAETVQNQSEGRFDGQAGEYVQMASGWLGRAADYVQDLDTEQLKLDIEHKVRNNPGSTLLIAGAAGFFLGLVLVRRRS